jgi:hypothetical protein
MTCDVINKLGNLYPSMDLPKQLERGQGLKAWVLAQPNHQKGGTLKDRKCGGRPQTTHRRSLIRSIQHNQVLAVVGSLNGPALRVI